MLTREENELLTRTGPRTPMGELLRRYWVPALLRDQLPGSDSAPVRVKVLGEELVAFRDTNGRVGLIGEYCAHRGASLFFGQNRDGGLRCVYHGWKFDVDGNCVEMPNEPPESRVKIRLKAYPCRELGGLVWTYMGPKDRMPALPELEWARVPDSHRFVSKRFQACNYLQAMEGGIDSSHISFLHRDLGPNRQRGVGTPSRGSAVTRKDTAPIFEVADTEYGLLIGARRDADEQSYYWRLTQWLMPWYTMIPPFGDLPLGGHAWVPIDDESCSAWSISWHPKRAVTEEEVANWRSGAGIHIELIPGTYLPKQNKSNNYLIDREAQRTDRSLSGIDGIAPQDMAVQESAGTIFDRTTEHLGQADLAIIRARQRLLQAVRDLQGGVEPPALDPRSHRIRSVSLILPKETPFQERAKEAMRADSADTYVVSA